MSEVEEPISGGDFRGGCMHRRVVKMTEHLPFCRKFSVFCVENRVVVNLGV